MTERAVVVRAPAKINLALAVGPLRADGYHDLATVFHAVSLADELTARPGDHIELTIEGEHAAGLSSGDDNLAVRAAQLVLERARTAGAAPAGVSLQLRKVIPVAAGLAGGSADAAAALVACNALYDLQLTPDDLIAMAAELGSDVPFSLIGGTAVGTGRGEQLSPVPVAATLHWVLGVSNVGLSTPMVYREFDRLRAVDSSPAATPDAGDRHVAAVVEALRVGDVAALARALHNDLEAAAGSLRPELRDLLAAGQALGALGGLVSGSGPTVAFLVSDNDHAKELAADLVGIGHCDAVLTASGPVPGPAPISGPVPAPGSIAPGGR